MMLELSWRVRPGRECKYCGEMRIESMAKGKHSIGGRMMLCKSCSNARTSAWRKANHESLLATRRAQYASDPEPHRKRQAEYKKANPEAVRQRRSRHYQKNKAKENAQAAAWKAANPDKVREALQIRRARKMSALIEEFTDVEIFERDGYTCYLCGRLTDPGLRPYEALKTVLEHRTPLSRPGGVHSRANCATACWECNARKGAKTEEEYREVQCLTSLSAA